MFEHSDEQLVFQRRQTDFLVSAKHKPRKPNRRRTLSHVVAQRLHAEQQHADEQPELQVSRRNVVWVQRDSK